MLDLHESPGLLHLGCLIYVSLLASHVGVLDLRESPCLSRWDA